MEFTHRVLIIIVQLLASNCKIDDLDLFAFIYGTSYGDYVLEAKKEGIAEIEPPYRYWLKKFNEAPPKKTIRKIIDEDLFKYVETHMTEAQIKLQGFIEEACRLVELDHLQPRSNPKLVAPQNVLQRTVNSHTHYIDMKHAARNACPWIFRKDRDAFLTLIRSTLVEVEMYGTGPDGVTVEVFTTGVYDLFDAPSQESVERVHSARSLLNGQANGPTSSEAVKYLNISNIWRPWLPGTSSTLVLKVFQVCGIAWAKAKLMRSYGAILGCQMGLGKTIRALGVIQAMADDPEFFPQLNVKLYDPKSNRITKNDEFFHQGDENRRSILLPSFNLLNRRHSLKARSDWTDKNNEDPLNWDYTLETSIGICIVDEASLVKQKTSNWFKDIQSVVADFYLVMTATLCDNTFEDARGPTALINTDRLCLDQNRCLNPFDLPKDDNLPILQGTEMAYVEYVVKEKDPVKITYDTVIQVPYGNRKVGEDIPPFHKGNTTLKFSAQGMEKYLDLVKPVAMKLMTYDEGRNGGSQIRFHINVFRTLHMMNTWASLMFLDEWTVNDMSVFRNNKYNLNRLLQTIEDDTKYEWSGTKSIKESSDVELFNCLKATGCPCESYHSGLSEVERQELLARFNSGKEDPFVMIMSTKLSAYGLNIQQNCSDEIMSGTSFSDPQEGQALARIYRIGQTRTSRAYKLVVQNTFIQVRMNKRYHKAVPDLIAHMAQEDDIAESDADYFADISSPEGVDSAQKVQDVVEK
ncbi:hypothetical protein ACHAP3_009459 [Botrytis cinerea]